MSDIPAITALPAAPSRSAGSATFSTDADALLGALPVFVTETNASIVAINDHADVITAQAAAAAAGVSVAAWVSGTTYAIGDVRYSPITFYAYRRKTAGAGTTDPSSDTTNWALVSGAGDVTTAFAIAFAVAL